MGIELLSELRWLPLPGRRPGMLSARRQVIYQLALTTGLAYAEELTAWLGGNPPDFQPARLRLTTKDPRS